MRSIIPLCLFNRHRPVRPDVRHDGRAYVGNCTFCGKEIRRKSRGKWLRDREPEWQPDRI